ncbi:MAG TPA: CPBP family intramembrane glutamic endopeptidase [Dermatophilaceae bacterium]|nr:CPBP family intramembrane glutamic endopeptidase [Dermatophilaceae bacterium]
MLVVNGFGEEAGWRGFLADTRLQRHGRAVTAGLVWVIWALWHLPLFWVVCSFRDFGPVEVVGWLVGLLLGSVVLTELYVAGARSVLVVAVWHTAYNVTTATEATAGLVAAVSSTAVMAAAVLLLLRRSAWRGPDVRPGAPPDAPPDPRRHAAPDPPRPAAPS